jgi:HNH endonuclease
VNLTKRIQWKMKLPAFSIYNLGVVPKKKRMAVLLKCLYYGAWATREAINLRRCEFTSKRFSLLSLEGARCYVCSQPAKHRHHVIPICRGGSNEKYNLVPLCIKCHGRMDILQTDPEFKRRYLGKQPSLQHVSSQVKWLEPFKAPSQGVFVVLPKSFPQV